jgi:hypothetical protein
VTAIATAFALISSTVFPDSLILSHHEPLLTVEISIQHQRLLILPTKKLSSYLVGYHIFYMNPVLTSASLVLSSVSTALVSLPPFETLSFAKFVS